MNLLRNIFSTNKGSASKIYMPHNKYSGTYKRYISTLDIINDIAIDFKQLISRLLMLVLALHQTGTFQDIDWPVLFVHFLFI